MPNITNNYWTFYLEGRAQKKLLPNDIAESDLAERLVRAGGAVRGVIYEACTAAARSLEGGRTKRTWITEHKEAIQEAGGNADLAYEAWLLGRTDELAYALEEDVIAAIRTQVDGEDEDDIDEDIDEDDEDDGGEDD
jgi:hypothetical protein